jgi:type I restriction enzyme S subunit
MTETTKYTKYTKRNLPSGWRWARLGDVCEVVGGSTPSTGNPNYWDGTIVWITPTDLGKNNCMTISSSERLITPEGLSDCHIEMLPVGTVVMSSRAPIGHLAIAKVPLCTNQGCKSFVPSSSVDSVYLYWALKQSVPFIQMLGSGATFAEVSKSTMQDFPIPLPPLDEQRRIVTILNEQMAAVDKARAAAEDKLAAINALPAALLRRAFDGEL